MEKNMPCHPISVHPKIHNIQTPHHTQAAKLCQPTQISTTLKHPPQTSTLNAGPPKHPQHPTTHKRTPCQSTQTSTTPHHTQAHSMPVHPNIHNTPPHRMTHHASLPKHPKHPSTHKHTPCQPTQTAHHTQAVLVLSWPQYHIKYGCDFRNLLDGT